MIKIGRELITPSLAKNMEEDVDETIKKRLELVKFDEKQKEALKELDNTLEKIDDANLKLQKLRDSEEKYLAEIVKIAEERVEISIKKLVKAGDAMKELEERATSVIVDIKNKSKRVQDVILGILGRAKDLVARADILMNNSEETNKVILKAQSDLEEKIIINSEFESILKKREKEVENKNKKGDKKLKEAKDLAFWHKDPNAKYKS